MNKPIVYLIDDDPEVRSSISTLLKFQEYKVKAFDSAEAFLEHKTEKYSCLILDINMPGMSGTQLQQILSSENNFLPIIFLTGVADVSVAVSAMKHGAIDLLTKPVQSKDLIAAIEYALLVIQRKLELSERQSDMNMHLESLTPREREVFDLVILGLLNKQIAYKIGTTERTVKAHRKKVMLKTGTKTVQELMNIAVKLNLLK